MTTIRPAREEDVGAAAELLNEHSRRLHGTDDLTPADLLLYWQSPDVELGQDILLAEDTDSFVGYADIGVHGDGVWLDIRGTDRDALPALLEAIEARGMAKAPDKDLLRHTFAEFANRGFEAVGLGVDAENPTGAVRVYERAGMHVERTSLIFERSQE